MVSKVSKKKISAGGSAGAGKDPLKIEESYRRLVELSPDMMALHSNGKYLYMNPAGLKILRASSQEEILGKPTFTTVHPDDREKVVEINRRRQRGEPVPSRYEVKGLRKDGRVIYVEVSATKVLYRGEARSLAYLRDITERKEAEEMLRVTQFCVDHASEAVVWMDAEGRFIYANEAACEASGYSQDELCSMRISDIDIDLTQEAWCARWVEKKQRGAITFESRYRSRDGRIFPVEIKADYAKVGDREYSFAFIRDITERKSAEEELGKQRQTFFTILENDPSGVSLIDKNGEYLYVNPEFTALTGYTLEDVPTGTEWFRKAYPDPAYRGNVIETWKENRLSPGRHIDVPFTITRKDGQRREIEFRTTFLEDYTITVLNDVTERKQAEEQITASLREKEALLKEIHHRVKNNLQIVSSLLYLQARNTEHPGAIEVLRDSQNRVRSMALIHEKLYGSPSFASVDMAEYARDLALQVFKSYRDGAQSTRLRTNLDNVSLDISQAIPCGLIINELVCNALKHAFPVGREGEITVQLQRGNGGKMTLVVADSGIGLPEDVDFQKSSSLGLNLVCALVKQLEGRIELDRSAGTAFEITFG